MNHEWHWYHVIASTYGAWVAGDRRGFRTRHHREHVEGDYKSPPLPGKYEGLERHSRESMAEGPVVLAPEVRVVVGQAVVQRLQGLGAIVVSLAASGQHLHLLAKMPLEDRRRWIGLAKRHVWFVLRDGGWSGKLWAKGFKCLPVKDRKHQLNVYRYILRHARQGAWVWSILQEKPQPPPEPPSPGPAPPGKFSPEK